MAVVIWHWQHFAYLGDALPKDFDRTLQPFYPLLKIFYENGWMGVEYFFLLSGFIFFWLYHAPIKNRTTGFADFWAYRFSRLYPLHFVTLLLVALLQGVFTSRNGSSFVYSFNDAYHFLLNLGFAAKWGLERGLSFNGPVWSVSVEILLYCIFFIVSYLRWGGAWFCLIFSVAAFSILQLAPRPIMSNGLSLFFLGGFLYHLTFFVSTRSPRLKPIVYSTAALSWFLTILSVYFVDINGLIFKSSILGEVVRNSFLVFFLFPSTIASLALLEIDRGRFLKPVSWIGDITYASYLLHFPLQLVFILAAYAGLLTPGFYLHPLSFLAFFLILVPSSYLTYIIFERPIQKMIRARYLTRRSPRQSAPLETGSPR